MFRKGKDDAGMARVFYTSLIVKFKLKFNEHKLHMFRCCVD